MRQRRAVVVHLRVLLRGRVGDAIRAGKESIKVIEAAVLGVDHKDVLDLVEVRRGCSRWLGGAARQRGSDRNYPADSGREAVSHSRRPPWPGGGGCHSS